MAKSALFHFVAVFTLLVFPSQQAEAQLARGILKLLGVKEDSGWMAVADVVDSGINSKTAKGVNSIIDTYGKDVAADFNTRVNDYNNKKNDALQQYMSEIDQFKMDYCKRNGFYDYWVQQYGDEWFEAKGRNWFDRQNEKNIDYHGESLLPPSLREDPYEKTNYDQQSDFNSMILGWAGLTTSDVDNANKWDSGNKYDRQDMIIGAATHIVSGFSRESADLVNTLGSLMSVQNQYNKDKGADQAEALSRRNADLANIVLDVVWEKKDRMKNKMRHVSDGLDLSSVLTDAGIDEEQIDVDDFAGVIMHIQEDESLTQEEKNRWYSDLGINNSSQDIVRIIDEANSLADDEGEEDFDDDDDLTDSAVTAPILPIEMTASSARETVPEEANAFNKTNSYYVQHPLEILPDAQIAFTSGSYDRSAELCRLHFALVDTSADALWKKASDCLELSKEMMEMFGAAEYDSAVQKANAILVLNPHDKIAQRIISSGGRNTGFLDKGSPAEIPSNQGSFADELSRNSSSVDENLALPQYLKLATECIRERNFKEALAFLLKVYLKNPENHEALYYQGIAWIGQQSVFVEDNNEGDAIMCLKNAALAFEAVCNGTNDFSLFASATDYLKRVYSALRNIDNEYEQKYKNLISLPFTSIVSSMSASVND